MHSTLPSNPVVVALRDACKCYRTGTAEVTALASIDLTIRSGEYVSIVGASGSGKSTLLNVLGTLDRLDAGTHELAQQGVNELDDEELSRLRARAIGFVFQAFHLLPRYTALENVELALTYAGVPRSERRARAEKALERVGLRQRISHLPSELSGGQQQRVSIARALVNSPALVLADEPTGALDSCTTREILDLFDQLNGEGTTMVVVTHDHQVARRAARLVEMRDGRIVRDAPAAVAPGGASKRPLGGELAASTGAWA